MVGRGGTRSGCGYRVEMARLEGGAWRRSRYLVVARSNVWCKTHGGSS